MTPGGIGSSTHEAVQESFKINLDKRLFRDQQVSYLGFTLTPQGIKPGKAKLKAIKSSEAQNDVKSIRFFLWDYATSSGTTYKTSPSQLHLCSSSPTRIRDTFQGHYQNQPTKLSKHSMNSLVMNQLWPSHKLTETTC